MAFAAVVGAVGAEHEVVDKAGEVAMLEVGDGVAAQFALGADETEIEAGVGHEAEIEAGVGHEGDEAGVGHEDDEAGTGAVQLGVLGLN